MGDPMSDPAPTVSELVGIWNPAKELTWADVYDMFPRCEHGGVDPHQTEEGTCFGSPVLEVSEPEVTDGRADISEERIVGIEVWGDTDTPIRLIWRVIKIMIPDGEISAFEWNGMTVAERRKWFLGVG